MNDRRVGIIGVGLMGSALAERLLALGFVPCLWNRTREEALPLLDRGATWSDRPLAECDRVIICLYSSDVVRAVLTPWLDQVREGQILLDVTTGDPEHSIELAAQLRQRGVSYLESPISGSSEQTRRGEATVIVSGDRRAFTECADLWPALGKQVFYVGASGNAAKTKLVSNLVLGLNRAALAEGLIFAESLGLDLERTLEVLQNSPAHSRQMDTKGHKMIGRDFTPQAKLSQHLKDVRLMLEAAEARGIELTLTEAHRQLLERAEAMGLGDLDNSAIVVALRKGSS